MIENNIVKWLELGDSIQKLEIYNKGFSAFIFYMYYLLSKHVHFSEYFHIFLMFLFFAQIWELNIVKVNTEGDKFLEIVKYLEKIFLFQKMISDGKTLKLILNLSLIIYFSLFLITIINMILLYMEIKYKVVIAICSFFNLLFIYYINAPLIQIFFYPLLFYNKKYIDFNYFQNNNSLFLVTIIFSLIFMFLIIFYVTFASLYISDIGCINNYNEKSKINSSYITLIIIIKIIFVGLEFLINYLIERKTIILVYYLLFFFVIGFIRFYTLNNVFYYNQKINIFHYYGWNYTIWFSFCIFLKESLKIKDITLFLVLGIILITIGFIFYLKYYQFGILTKLNIFESKSLKDIEIFNELLINLSKENNYKSKALIAGIIKRIEENIKDNPELKELYYKIINDKYLKKKFNSLKEIKILSIILIIYSYNIEKSKDITELTFHMCYFLINYFKNPLYAISLSTKVKPKTHIQSYYKFVLMEEIKEYFIRVLNKNKNKLSLKHIQISSVILYNQFIDLFKMKIYDATCSQIDYFDILKNNITTRNTTENFLNLGESILSLKKDIMNLWDRIILLNPFNNETEKDYLMYLDTILQDEVLKKSELKKFNSLKVEQINEKNNLYYSMFNKETTAVLLSDGYSNNGKILYATPNFTSLFMFTGKEILNTSIDELLPDAIQNFHKFLIEEAIKYSNLSYIFNDKRDVLLKGKNGGIFNIYLYVKPVPDLTFGLIYFIYIEKIQNQNLIFILDEDFKINGFTETNTQTGSNFTINNNYGLTKLINGNHIGLVIPEILFQIDYNEKNNMYYFLKNNIEMKGHLYETTFNNNLDSKIEKIMESIKDRKIYNDNKYNSFEEYDDFIRELNKKYTKTFSIFFRIQTHSFVDGKYKYYRIYVINDILSDNEIPTLLHSNLNSDSIEENNSLKDIKFKSKIKNSNNDNNIYDSKNKPTKQGNFSNKNIKLKTIINRQSKILMKKEADELNKELNNNKEIIFKDNQNKKQITSNVNNKQSSKGPNLDSNANKAVIESAEFNKLKNEIIEKTDSFYIKLMKVIASIFLLVMIILMIIEYKTSKKIVNSIIEFLDENKFFIYTKIGCACIYNSAFNLQLIKENVIPYNLCPNNNCTSFYADLLQQCYTEIIVQKYRISSFFPDFKVIFSQKINVELYIYNSTYTDHLNLDIDMFLNLVISKGLKIIANLTNYIDDNSINQFEIGKLNIYFKNLLDGALKYFYSDYEGFSGEEKELKCSKATSNPPYGLIISMCLWGLSSSIFFILICKKNVMEIYFLGRLINFTSSNFDDYLKNLEELKKKFRENSNDEEDKNRDELDFGLDDAELEEKNENNSKNNKTDKDKNVKNRLDNNKESPNKKKNKQIKIQQQRLKKKKVMSDFFNKYNISFGLKVSFLFLCSASFFILILGNIERTRNNYKKFDSYVESINILFYKYFKTFLIFKEQLEILYHKKDKTKFLIPAETELEKPKLGNSLMYFFTNSKYSKETLTNMEKLYSKDACNILAKNENENKFCESLLSSILTKGLEQSIVQMSLIINSCIEELNALRTNITVDIFSYNNSTYAHYDIFMGYYMVESFFKTKDYFESFGQDEKIYIYKIIGSITISYFIINIILIILFIYYIHGYKKVENSFLNFIGIFPSKFIADDENFYKSIFKFGEYYC